MVETEAATTSTQTAQPPISLSLSISEVWDLKVWCFGITHAVILRGTGRVTFVPGILFTLLWAQTTLHCIKQHWIQISILPWCHLNDWGWRAQACKDKYIPHVDAIVLKECGLTEISRVVICWAVEAQVLQIRNEVRDGALVYALTLTEDVQLENKQSHQDTADSLWLSYG